MICRKGKATRYAIEARLGDIGENSYELVAYANTLEELLTKARINEINIKGNVVKAWALDTGVPFYTHANKFLVHALRKTE